MAGKKVGWNIGGMPDKMIAMATFHGELLKKIHNDPVVATRIKNAGANIVSKYFEAYVDASARIDPYRYHHIYEFGKTGNKTSRLFRSSIRDGVISYRLVDASVPNKDGYLFNKKAFVMEAGDQIVVTPKNGKVLVYDLNGDTMFSNKSVIEQPGGPYVAGSFEQIFNEFFSSNMPNKALKEFGFFDAIEKGLKNETDKAASRINSGAVKQSAQMAAQAAYGIAGKVEDRGNRL